jgi:hypothetical protein
MSQMPIKEGMSINNQSPVKLVDETKVIVKPVEETKPVEKRERAKPEDLDALLRDLDHLSFNDRLNSHYRKVCERAAALLRKRY